MSARVVTRFGECFEVQFQRKRDVDSRDGLLYLYHLLDSAKSRGLRRVSVFRVGSTIPNFDNRIDPALLNRLRRGFDSGEITFDVPESANYKEIVLDYSDFDPQPPATDEEIRQFIVHTVYWLSYRYGNRLPVSFEDSVDLEYLGVGAEDMRRNVWLLEQDGLLEKSNIPGMGRPTARLIKAYEARKSTPIGNEQVFPKGTQYEAFKAIKNILRSAKTEIVIMDNYLDDSVLDVLEALPAVPSLKLLTSKTPKDFKVAVSKFKSQYQSPIEVRLHHKQVHDRVIMIDDVVFYALGASIKDAGTALFFINKLEDQSNIARVRSEFQAIWGSSQPL